MAMTAETRAVRALMRKAIKAGKKWFLTFNSIRGYRSDKMISGLVCPLGAVTRESRPNCTSIPGIKSAITGRVWRAADGHGRADDRAYLLKLAGLKEEHPNVLFRPRT